MKKIILIAIILTAELFASSFVYGQGTLYVSNLGQTPTGSAIVGSDSWLAQSFTTGNNSGGYLLNSIRLQMDASSGTPGGFAVSIYNNSNNPLDPGSSIGDLIGSASLAGGLFAYTTSGIMLAPSTLYFVVITAATPVAQGTYTWSATGFGSQIGIDNWSIFGVYDRSSDGLNWQTFRNFDFQLGIYATPVPEPSSLLLLFLGGGICLYVRARRHRSPPKNHLT